MICRATTTRRAFVISIAGPLVGCVLAQAPQFVPLEVPGINDAMVQAITMDTLGALWLGTDRGLVRFDGTTSERYVSDPADPLAPKGDFQLDVIASEDEVFAACSGGVFCINAVNSIRQQMRFKAGDAPSVDLECLSFASSSHGVWAFAGGNGVFRFEHGDSVFRKMDVPEAPPRAGGGWEAPDGSLWFTDRTALRHFDPATRTGTIFPCMPFGKTPPPKTLLVRVIPDRFDPNVLWCTSWGLGFVRFDMRTGEFRPFVVRTPLGDLWNIVRTAVQTAPDRWLLGLDDALYTFTTDPEGDRSDITVADADMRAIGSFRSPNGDLFIGSTGHVHLAPSAPTGVTRPGGVLSGSNINAAPAANDDGYWAVRFYSDRMLLRTDSAGRPLFEVPFPVDALPFEPFEVLAARHDPEGRVWVASTRGLWCYRPGAALMELVPLKVEWLRTERPNVQGLAEDEHGRIWLALTFGGVLVYDPTTDGTTSVQRPEENGNARMMSITPLDPMHMLAVPSDRPPLVINVEDLTVATFPDTDPSRHLFAGIVGGTVISDTSVLLYSAGLGLKHFTRSRGTNDWALDHTWYLPSRPAFQDAALDGTGRVWLTSDRGAYLLDIASGQLHRLDRLHGVNSTNTGSVSRYSNGDILLTGGGLSRFSASFEPRADSVRLVVRKVSAKSEDITASLLTRGSIDLEYRRNDLAITFGCIALLDGSVFNYAYRLSRAGETGTWSGLGNQHEVTLLGLAPGNYSLELRAEGFSIPTTGTVLHFNILPPWWATWWARVLMVALAIAGVVLATRQVLAIRYRRRLREVEREREVERVRMRIARDIHDGIGSGLTKITLMTRQLHGEAGTQGERIAVASTELVKELGEIVWTVDPRNDSFGSFVAFVRNSLGRQFEHLPVALVADLSFPPDDAEFLIGPEIKRNVLLTLKEAVNNALKHSGASRVDVAMHLTRKKLLLRVKDNGKGFDPTNVRDGANGLVNFTKRAEAIGGKAEVRTSAEGTTVMMEAPLPSTNM